MNITILSLTWITLLIAAVSCKSNRFQNEIDKINQDRREGKSSWTAQKSDEIDYDNEDELRSRCGIDQTNIEGLRNSVLKKLKQNKKLLGTSESDRRLQSYTPPASINLKELYPNCTSIGRIRNQSGCSSCWAVSAATSLTDRFCINSVLNGTLQERYFSFEDMLERTNTTLGGFGCSGGYIHAGFDFAKKVGVVTGDQYGNFSFCKSYFLAPGLASRPPPVPTYLCDPLSTYPTSFQNDQLKISDFSFPMGVTLADTVNLMMAAISLRGSILAFMQVFVDFYFYKTGIYTVTSTVSYGAHGVRIIGYGTENGVDYWLCANSWGASWGENGFFRIKKGVNMSMIEYVPIEGII
jgi:cathepsin B